MTSPFFNEANALQLGDVGDGVAGNSHRCGVSLLVHTIIGAAGERICRNPGPRIPKGLVGYRNEFAVLNTIETEKSRKVRLADGVGRESCKRRGELRAGGRAA